MEANDQPTDWVLLRYAENLVGDDATVRLLASLLTDDHDATTLAIEELLDAF